MYIVSILVKKRTTEIPEVQSILTKYGENIISRLGIYNINKNKEGLIMIIYGNENIEEFIEELNTVNGTDVNYMEV